MISLTPLFAHLLSAANVTKAHLLLGYESKVPIDEGIRRTVEWWNATYLRDG